MLYYDAATKKVSALNGSGRAPAVLSVERVKADCPAAGDEMPALHAHTVTVPGAAAGWADAVEKWGALPLAASLAPAIALADEGFPVSVMYVRSAACMLARATPARRRLISRSPPSPPPP